MQPNLSGQTLGKYELRELLGEGGMGAVYRAYDHNLKREVAVKIINLAKNDTALRGRFIREAETAASLEHSHIVRIYDYGVERDINYIVMQNLTGGALSDRMKQASEEGRPRASLPEVALLLEQLASALDYAHAQGVIHRDIKPQNVMFNNQGQAFIVDFGIAKLLTGATNMTGTGMAMGTPSYMSPEQWTTDSVVPASDQYALAVMTYQLIAGRLPFEADTPMRVMYRHLNDQPTPLNTFRPDIPADLLLVMDRALAKDPEQRFPNCTQFAQAFSSAVSVVSAGKTEFFTFKLARIRPSGVPYTPAPSQHSSTPATPASNRSLPSIPLTQQPKSGPSRNVLIGGLGALVVIGILAVVLLGNRGPSESDLRLTEVNSTLIAAGLATENAATQTRVGIEVIASVTPEPTNTVTDFRPTETATSTATASSTATTAPTGTDIPSPTVTVSATLTDTPTETATDIPDVTLDVRLAAIATRDGLMTSTATLWTPTPTATQTPTPDIPATIAAEITALYREDLTATATVWTPTFTFTPSLTNSVTATTTHTPTATITNTSTATPTLTSTLTPSFTPTLNYTATIDSFARAGITRNSDWTPIERDFASVTMALVPAGCFDMGSVNYDDEQPVHEICFDVPFWIDKTEVTQAQFSAKGGTKANPNRFSGDDRPVENVTWFEANAYCEARGARLPTEAEWEYAARGPDALRYPWGDSFTAGTTVYSENSGNQTASVNIQLGPSWVAASGMSGNVWEWTSSLYQPYPYKSTDGREASTGSRTDIQRVLRGGSWTTERLNLRTADRSSYSPDSSYSFVGFRCANDFDQLLQNEAVTQLETSTMATVTLVPTVINAQVEISDIIGEGNIISEHIEIVNRGATVTITDWILRDLDGNIYTFPETRLFNDGLLEIWTMAGSNTPLRRYMGYSNAIADPGDIITLLDTTGNVQSVFRIMGSKDKSAIQFIPTLSSPVAEPTTSGEPIIQSNVDLFVNCDSPPRTSLRAPSNLAAGSTVQIWWYWYARTEEQIAQHLAEVEYDIRINGQPISDPLNYVQPIRQAGDFVVDFFYPMGELQAGIYKIDYRATWSHQIFDGYNFFGPGTDRLDETGTCTFVVR